MESKYAPYSQELYHQLAPKFLDDMNGVQREEIAWDVLEARDEEHTEEEWRFIADMAAERYAKTGEFDDGRAMMIARNMLPETGDTVFDDVETDSVDVLGQDES